MHERPNILVFQSDDHGQWAAEPYGNRELRNPSLQELARTGTRLDRAFTTCPVCSPGRASFWTGKVPSAHGIHDFLASKHEKSAHHPGLQGQVTLAQQLQRAGYRTGLAGKWHCHHNERHHPGFDHWYGNCTGSGNGPHFGRLRFSHNGTLTDRFGYQTPMVTDAALDFLRQSGDGKPFFLYVGYTDTHAPFEKLPPRLVQAYSKATFADVPEESPPAQYGGAWLRGGRKPADPAGHRECLAQYYAGVTFMDEQVGRILDELEAQGLRENTLVIYTADHGHMNGQHGLYGKGNATRPQNFFDESILVPCLMSWPNGGIPADASRREPVDLCDVYATLLEVADAPPAEDGVARPGRSVLPMIAADASDWRTWQCCEYGNARMIRTERYKLIRRSVGLDGPFPDELYDLVDDPRETTNRIGDPTYQNVTHELDGRLQAYFQRYAIDCCDGRRVQEMPWHNPVEPWRDARGDPDAERYLV